MKKFCKVLGWLFLLAGCIAAGIFCEILFTRGADFGSDRYVVAICFSVLGAAIFGTFFLTRMESGPKRVRIVRTVTVIGGIAYGMCLIGILFMSRVSGTRRGGSARDYSLIPFRTISMYVKAYLNHTLHHSTVYRNLLGNFVLFMPMAWILPVVFKKLRNGLAFTIVMLLGLCMVELTQFKTGRGSMDIDDIILNYSGAILVFLCLWNKTIRKFMEKRHIVSGRTRKVRRDG